jgi:hypothetical protein
MLTTFIIIVGLVVLFNTLSDKFSHTMTEAEVDAIIGKTQSAYRYNTKEMK